MDDLKQEEDIKGAVGEKNNDYVVLSNQDTFEKDGNDKEID